jgi:pimeloyl-ACP methyl ester carboxylesterase
MNVAQGFSNFASLITFAAILLLILWSTVGIRIAAGFLLHYFDTLNRGEHGPGIQTYVRIWFNEWLCEIAALLAYPLGFFTPNVPEKHDPHGGPPIILLHGFFHNRGCFFVLFWRLRRYGYKNIYPLNLKPTTASINVSGDKLAVAIEAISQTAGNRKVIVVGHSMGGLVARACLKSHPDVPIFKLITVATPHIGTRAAWLGYGESCH